MNRYRALVLFSPRPLLVMVLAAGPAAAQLTSSLVAPTTLTATASTAGAAQTSTQPAGPLPLGVWLTASAGGDSFASYSALTVAYSQGFECQINQQARASTTTGAATAGPNTILWEVAAAQPAPALVRVDFFDSTTPGVPQPAAFVDVGDDGVVDFVNGQAVQPQTLVTVGTQPLRIRITTYAATAQVGVAHVTMVVHVEPHNLVDIQAAAFGCGATIAAIPTFFDTGVEVLMPTAAVVVFGFSVQPVLLPPNGTLPCLGIPSLDVLLHLPPGGGAVHVPLPAAVRPATFWVQGVTWSFAGLQLSDAYRVHAF